MPRSLTLLVVEDETLVAMELEDILEDLGHFVADVAGSAERALDVLRAAARKPDAVLLDANLGGKSGLVVAKTLDREGIPFVITSGYDQHELLTHGYDVPCVSKPYGPIDIDRALKALPID